MQTSTRRATCSLPCSVAAPREARHFVLDQLRLWDCSVSAYDVALVTSELVTNAVIHGGCRRTEVVLEQSGAHVEVSVVDSSTAAPTVTLDGPAPADPLRLTGGRGMQIVSAIAAEWGVRPQPEGKVVWVRLPAQGS